MGFLRYVKSLIRSDTADSSKSFALVVSILMGALASICVCISMLYDVFTNGYIKTDLDSLGVFLLCVGGFMAGGGINKAVFDSKKGSCTNEGNRNKESESQN